MLKITGKSSDVTPRSPLFIPGNRADMLAKAARYSPYAYVPDLEDSVPVSHKLEAREILNVALPSLIELGKPVIPRVNSLTTGLTEGDLSIVVRPGVLGISIGKVCDSSDIERVASFISELEPKRGIAEGSIGILPWLENASAVVNAFDICSASERVRWVAFGAEDYSADMGISREVDEQCNDTGRIEEYGESSLLYARSAVAVAAQAANVIALDTPYVRFRDEEGLRREARLARRLGYRGKFAIHPAQINVIEELFAPSEDEIARARKIVYAAEKAALEGRGAIDVDGEMVDAPVVERARNVLTQVRDC